MSPVNPQLSSRAEPSQSGLEGLVPNRGHRCRVSIIIVNYNGRQHVDRVLRSLQKDAGRDCEVIVVDNASRDDSAQHVASRFPEVTLICNRANLGFAAANNRAAHQAQGKYLAFLNPDAEVEPGWLEALIAALERQPGVGLVTAQILLMHDANRINACGNDMHLTGFTMCRALGTQRRFDDGLTEIGAVSGAAFVIPHALYEALGGFDESFFLYMEDSDLSLRARLAGYRCLYVPSSRVYHDYQLRFGPGKVYYQERNRYAMLLKTFRWPTLLAMVPSLALGELVAWGFILLYKPQRWCDKLRAYAWLARRWQKLMQDRRQTQRLRRVPDRDLLRLCTYGLDYGQVSGGPLGRMAGLLIDPLFLLLRCLVLAVVRW
ncbi:MAG: glycosyltransferase family 2 protein [Anaerolineae bacterium]